MSSDDWGTVAAPTQLTGTVGSVESESAGAMVAANASVGATTLVFYDEVEVSDVLKFGDGESVTITATSDDHLTGTCAALAQAKFDGDFGVLQPEQRTQWAYVQVDPDDDPIQAKLPYGTTLPEGPRLPTERERVVVRLNEQTDEWTVGNVLGIDLLDNIPPPSSDEITSDGVPPTAAANLTLDAMPGMFSARWVPVTNADPVWYEVHLSTTNGFTPSGTAPGSGTCLAVTPAASLVFRTAVNGSALVAGTTYYVRVIARDKDGAASPTGQAGATFTLIGSADITDGAVKLPDIDPNTRPKLGNLITNGGAEEGTNLNFPLFTAVAVTDAVEGSYVFQRASGAGGVPSAEYIPVDTSIGMVVYGSARSISDGGSGQNRYYLGIQVYDQQKRTITPRHVYSPTATLATLTADAGIGATTLAVDDTTPFAAADTLTYVAMGAQADLSDTPNYATYLYTAKTATSLTLSTPLTVAYPAGSKIRYHREGGTYLYAAASNVALTTAWQKFSAIVSGVAGISETPATKWRKGTAFATIINLVNYPDATVRTTQVDGLGMETAIEASRIIAGSVTADRLVIGNFDNLAENPGFESGQVSWFATVTPPHGWSVVNDPANARTGNYCCSRTVTGGATAYKNGNVADCTPGDQFYGEAYCKGSAGVTGTAYMRIAWLNAAGAELSYSQATAVTLTTSYQVVFVTGTAPANAIRARLDVVAANTAGTCFFDDVYLHRVAISAFIADAAIITAKIGDLQVNNAKIADATIQSAKIVSLVADKITAGVFTAAYTISGSIKTATSGSRVEIDSAGIRLYDSGSNQVIGLNASTGAGLIGGWSISQSAISATNITLLPGAANVANIVVGSGANSGGLGSPAAGTDIAIWAGSTFANRATAPFRVTAAGAVTASTVSITGGSLDIPAPSVAGFHVDTSGNFSAGGTTATNGPFKVSAAGIVTASRIKIDNIGADTTPLTIKDTFSGTSNMMEFRNASDALLSRISGKGAWTQWTADDTTFGPVGGGTGILIRAGSDTSVQWTNSAGTGYDVRIRAAAAAAKTVVLDDTAGGAANLRLFGDLILGTATDVRLQRSAANTVTIDNAAGGAATVIVNNTFDLLTRGTAPANPAAGSLRLYVTNDASAHPQLRVRNSAGTVQALTTFADGA